MAEFDPSQPAILHERAGDRIIPWTGEQCEQWRQCSRRQGEGVIAYDGLLFDGWGNPLGG